MYSTEDVCCFLRCFGNELQNIWLLTYQLQCSVNWLIAKSVCCHSYLFFLIFSSVASHCASLYLGCLSTCELFFKKRQWIVKRKYVHFACHPHMSSNICLLLASFVVLILSVYMSVYSSVIFFVHLTPSLTFPTLIILYSSHLPKLRIKITFLLKKPKAKQHMDTCSISLLQAFFHPSAVLYTLLAYFEYEGC